MQLLNLHNKDRFVYKFLRNEEGIQLIEKDESFWPFYFEPDDNGDFVSYDGIRLKKITTTTPSDIPKQRSNRSYSSNVIYTKNYMIHKVDKLDLTCIKYFFIDIEVMTKRGDTVETIVRKGNRTVTCISLYNSLSKSIQTWWIKDMPGNTLEEQEKELLDRFIIYFKKEAPDLWLSWNVNFDYCYLHNRYKNYFANSISPLGQSRSSDVRDYDKIYYPAGVSIIDYLRLFKKVSMREASYALDYIAQKYFKEESWGKEDFTVLSDTVKEKNINDIKRMIKIEEKFKILKYFDSIRRLTKSQWEDLYYNSRIVESLLFEEAKNRNVVLSNNRTGEKGFAGATREVVKTGALFNIGKYDISSAYPSMIVNFCLDKNNIRQYPNDNTITIQDVHFEQNPDCLQTSMVKKVLILKDNLKSELGSHKPDTDDWKQSKINYDAIKAIVNSFFGVSEVAGTIAFLVKDVLEYVIERLGEIGIEVVYYDTDGIFISSIDDISDVFNDLVNEWARVRYNKENIKVDFTYEGYYERLFILTKCRYVGDLVTKKGIEHEIKGVEMKRADASKYSKVFQKELIDKILNKVDQEEVIKWIIKEQKRIKELPLSDVSFPCKLNDIDYKSRTIFVRALEYRKDIDPNFDVDVGELFYYVFVNNSEKDNEGKIKNVIAFRENESFKIMGIGWNDIIRRNILLKAESVFEAMGWETARLNNTRQLTLF